MDRRIRSLSATPAVIGAAQSAAGGVDRVSRRHESGLDAAAGAESIGAVFALVLRTAEFLFYHLLLSAVDRVSRLPRDTTIPEAMRLYRENIALKAQLHALGRRLALYEGTHGRKPVDVGTRAAPSPSSPALAHPAEPACSRRSPWTTYPRTRTSLPRT